MKKRKTYLFSPYPTSEKKNEFIDNFFNTLAEKVHVINHGKKPGARSADFLKYMFKADVMILNWPEDILHLRFGLLQLLSSFITLTLYKTRGGKIVWICHNKDSHKKKYQGLRRMVRSFFTNISNVIIVLSQDALNYFVKEKGKTYFLNHPVYLNPPLLKEDNNRSSCDVLIWGRISPYKGLNEFIGAYREKNNSFSVNITGHADKTYLQTITQNAKGLNINIIDEFISNIELENHFKKSKIILLPYADSDTFSSGALVHSLSSNKIVMGPAIGNFLDLNKQEACLVYENFTNLFFTLNLLLNNQVYYDSELARLRKGIVNYYRLNTWGKFIEEIVSIVEEK